MNIRIGIIAAMVIGVTALIKALSDGANMTGPWVAIAFLSFFAAIVAMMIIPFFGGSDSLSGEEMEEPRDDDPLADDDLNPDEIRHIKAMRLKARK